MADLVTSTTLDKLGEGYGFRKVRAALGVEAFGVNGIVMPPGFVAHWHHHDEQDELYFVHRGTARVDYGGPDDTSSTTVPAGGLFHVPAHVLRRVCNIGEDDLVLLVVGGKGGYVGRDGRLLDQD